ncbi:MULTISPECIES: hypothetical protein [unclassified Microbacterium]|uniref:hypothetical protein n=1 Tax=unclassified Microbacterium TaxID=2609290 RepID=UPI00164F5C52|nr:hypothetical protein [Microbacterium sp. 4-7]MBC6495710.1 hypothetical protein [Microbacterium sp. 4-7]
MQMLDTLALVGEVLSWVGLGLGLPMLLIGVLIRTIEGPWLPAEIAIIERDGALLARWFAGGDFHERPLSRQESATAEAGWADGVVSANNPSHARVGEPPHARRVVLTLGIVFAGVGFVGLVVSLLPLLWS